MTYDEAEVAEALRRIGDRPPIGRSGRGSTARHFAGKYKEHIAQMIAAGHSTAEIARKIAPVLGVRPKTVEAHIRGVVGKKADRKARKSLTKPLLSSRSEASKKLLPGVTSTPLRSLTSIPVAIAGDDL